MVDNQDIIRIIPKIGYFLYSICVLLRLVDGRRTGRIELEFYGAEDRENLIDALKKIGK